MKRRTNFVSYARWLPLLIVIALVTLTACERPLREDVTPAVTIVTTPGADQPGLTPLPEQTLVPGQTTAGETPPTQNETPVVPPIITGPENPTPADTTPVVAVPTAVPQVTAEPTRTSEVEYVVAAGDTLGAIAQRFGVSVEEIAARNNLADVDSISAGQTLIIPVAGSATNTTPGGEQVHIVQPGENLFRIGLLYGFTAAELAAYNNIADPDQIEVGQAIRIPPSN